MLLKSSFIVAGPSGRFLWYFMMGGAENGHKIDVCPDMEFFTSPCLDMPEEFFQCGGVSGRVENCGAGRRIGAACGKGI